MKQTSIKIYGVEYYTKTKEYKERIRKYWENLTDEEISNLFKNRLHKFKAPNGKTYDSSWEYKFEQYLIENNINMNIKVPLNLNGLILMVKKELIYLILK